MRKPREGFECFAAAQGPNLLRLCLLLTGRQADAEDLLQTALTRLVVKWPLVERADDPCAEQ